MPSFKKNCPPGGRLQGELECKTVYLIPSRIATMLHNVFDKFGYCLIMSTHTSTLVLVRMEKLIFAS